MIDLLNNEAYQTLVIVATIISATAVFVWKGAQFSSRIEHTVKDQGDDIAELKVNSKEHVRLLNHHNVRLTKLETAKR